MQPQHTIRRYPATGIPLRQAPEGRQWTAGAGGQEGEGTFLPAAPPSRRRLLAGMAGGLVLMALRGKGRAGARPINEDGVPHAPLPRTLTPKRRDEEESAPAFSLVEEVEPWDGLLFLAGRHPRYPGASLDSLMGYSAADILETTDTDVMDAVLARHGPAALDALYQLIAAQVLAALARVYGGQPLVLALDAGHGGKPGVYHDPGSHGTEAQHARRTAAWIEVLAAGAPSVTVRRIYNDAIGDDFFLPPPNDRKGAAALTLRNIRGAMLAHEAADWNAAHAGAPVAVHVISVHFNAGSGGILVLHQGSTVAPEFQGRSVAFAREYVAATRPALNATGLLPYTLRLALGTGLSDDALLYEPAFRTSGINPYTGVDRSRLPRRYAMLQTSLMQRDYADGALRYHGLV